MLSDSPNQHEWKLSWSSSDFIQNNCIFAYDYSPGKVDWNYAYPQEVPKDKETEPKYTFAQGWEIMISITA